MRQERVVCDEGGGVSCRVVTRVILRFELKLVRVLNPYCTLVWSLVARSAQLRAKKMVNLIIANGVQKF